MIYNQFETPEKLCYHQFHPFIRFYMVYPWYLDGLNDLHDIIRIFLIIADYCHVDIKILQRICSENILVLRNLRDPLFTTLYQGKYQHDKNTITKKTTKKSYTKDNHNEDGGGLNLFQKFWGSFEVVFRYLFRLFWGSFWWYVFF